MSVYYITIFATFCLSLLCDFSNKNNRNVARSNGLNVEYKASYSFLFWIIVFIFVFVSGFRFKVGADYYSYFKSFSTYQDWDIVKQSIMELDEPGIKVLFYISGHIWNNEGFGFFVVALVTMIPIFVRIKDFPDLYLWEIVLLFILLGCWMNSFNAVRQCCAVSIVFAGSKKSEKHWLLKYVFIVFVAFLFHRSAIVMFPLLLLCNNKITLRQIVVIVVGTIVLMYSYDAIFNYLGKTNEDMLTEYDLREINPLRVAVQFAPLLLIFIVDDIKDFLHKEKFFVNMLIVNATLTLITMNSAYLNRIALFTKLFCIIGIPKLFSRLKYKPVSYIIVFLAFVLYFLFWRTETTQNTFLVDFYWIFGENLNLYRVS